MTVLEMRADEKGQKPLHARPHQISLRQDTLESLKDLGAYNEVIDKSGWATKKTRNPIEWTEADDLASQPDHAHQVPSPTAH